MLVAEVGVAEKPSWAKALERRMADLHKSANAVARDSKGEDGESVSQAYVSGLLSGRFRLDRADRPKLRALARGLGWSVNDLVREAGLSALGVGYDPETPSRVTPEIRARGEAALESFRADAKPWRRVPFYGAGAGPFRGDEEPAGFISVADDGFFERYPGGLLMQINGACLEPDWPEGWYASVVPDPALAVPGSVVVVWLSDNGRVLKRLVQFREEGDHVLYQDNPPPGERHTLVAPVGSRILGVAVDVRRGRSAPFSLRRMYETVEREMPEALELEASEG